MVTTRIEVEELLQAWVKGEKTPLQVWQWAELAKQAGKAADELVRDVVDTLAVLPFDMITTDDVPVILDALSNPIEETDLSVNLLWNHLDGIATDMRRFDLRKDEFYGQFSDGMD